MLGSDHTVESITAEDEIVRLKEDWDRLSLAAQNPNVFTTYDWFWAWYRRFSRKECVGKLKPHILVLKRHGKVTGISPLICTTSSRFGLSLQRLNFVAREWDYNDLLVGEDAEEQTTALVEFLSHTSSDWDILDLRDMRDAGNAVGYIKSALACAGLPYRVFREEQRCPYMLLNRPWSEMMSHHSRSTRRMFRRFSALTVKELRFRIVETPQREPRLLEKLIAVEAQKNIGGKLSCPFLGKYSDVFQTVIDQLGPQGWIMLVLLESEDRLVAWQFLYRCGKSLWGSLNAYDHAFSSISPGTMLIPPVIDYGFAHGFEEFDFLSGEESYKLRWTSSLRQTYRLVVWNRRQMSRIRALAYLKLRVRIPR